MESTARRRLLTFGTVAGCKLAVRRAMMLSVAWTFWSTVRASVPADPLRIVMNRCGTITSTLI